MINKKNEIITLLLLVIKLNDKHSIKNNNKTTAKRNLLFNRQNFVN